MRVLLFSGGIDSSAIAHWLRPDVLLTVNYGQKAARGEVSAATAIAEELRLEHEVLEVDLSHLGQGLMSHQQASALAQAPEWWPYRNQMLITLAGMRFVTSGLREIVIGAVASDAHEDGKPPFLSAINHTMQLQEGHVKISAPASHFLAEELLEHSAFPTNLLGLTFSCHISEFSCGKCPGCSKHSKVLSNVSSKA